VVNSGYLNGLSVASAKEAITERLAAQGRAQARVEYKLRDWLFARQRYWVSRSRSCTTRTDGRTRA